MTTSDLRSPETVERCRLTLAGEIDIANASDYLAVALAVINGYEDDCLTVDLSGVTFIDSTGLGMLLDVRTAAREAGKQLRFCGTPERVQRLLEITGLIDLLAVQ